MHTVISLLPFAIWALSSYGIDRWNQRPAARARWAALSLRAKIARQIRRTRLASAYQVVFLALGISLHMAGLLSFGSWLAGVITAVLVLAVDLYLLHHALAMRRAYDGLGPLAYLAEIRHAFGTLGPHTPTRAPGSDQNGSS